MRTPLLSLVAVALVASACSGASSTGYSGPSSAPGHHLPTAAPWPGEPHPTPSDGGTYQDPGVNP